MPTMADIVVKKADAVTNITYSALNPGSDNAPSLWKAPPTWSIEVTRPSLTIATRYNGPRTARRVTAEYVYPQAYQDTTTGLVSVKNQTLLNCSGLIPLGMTPTDISEAVAQFGNLFASALVQSVFKTSYNAN